MKQKLLISLLAIIASLPLLAQPCSSGESWVEIDIIPDDWYYETSWTITDLAGDTLFAGDTGYYQMCVADTACLNFNIYDTYGDGIYSPGGYWLSIDGSLLAHNDAFGFGETVNFNCPPGYDCGAAISIGTGSFVAPMPDTWYAFTPDSNGRYYIDACDTCDTRIWIYDYCTGLIWDHTNEGSIYYSDYGCPGGAAELYANLAAGETYYIRIGEQVGANCNSISWSLAWDGYPEGCTDSTSCNFDPIAVIDNGSCLYYPDPLCPNGPDLWVREDVFASSMYLDVINNTDPCLIAEGCVNGYGDRDIIRFTTEIQNIGDVDYYVGNTPPWGSPSTTQWEWDVCHGHWHYEGYAEYTLYDTSGTALPSGFKNGFCVMDLSCAYGGGTAQYGCGEQGISAHCGDIYSSGLQCQWIDITDVDTGRYTLVIRVNWDGSPDKLGRYEMSYTNNWAQVCIRIGEDALGNPTLTQLADCDPFIDCAGNIYGSAVKDCNGDCNGTAVRGDLNTSGYLETVDAQQYNSEILANSISPTSCNDLNDDGLITVYDAALASGCVLFTGGHIDPGGGAHEHCDFPGGAVNIFDTVSLRIAAADFEDQWVDIEVRNPDSKILGYEFNMSGIEILNVVNAADVTQYPISPETSLGGTKVIGLSYQDSVLERSGSWQPLCRIYYFDTTAAQICIDEIIDIPSQFYEQTLTKIVGGCIDVVIEEDTTVGIQTVSANPLNVQVFPNPFTSHTTVVFDNRSGEVYGLELYTLTGQQLRSYQISGNEQRIERGTLSEGVYLFKLLTKDGSYTGRVVIQ